MEPQTLTTVAEPLVNRWFDECLAGRVYLKPTGASYYRAGDGGNAHGVVTVESGEFDLPKASVTQLTELEAIAPDGLKMRLRELRQEFERFPEGTYLWMWWSKPYPGADSRYMPAFDEQAHEDEFRRLRALSIRGAHLLAELQPSYTEAPVQRLEVGPIGTPAPQPEAADNAVPVAETTPAADASVESLKAERKKLLDDYKAECKRKDIKVTNEMIARAASQRWHSRTQVQKWLDCDPDYDGEPDRLIRKVFEGKPHLKPSLG